MTIDNPELTLTLSIMVIQTFVKETGFAQYSDAQDIEDLLSTKMTITYTSDDKISEISCSMGARGANISIFLVI